MEEKACNKVNLPQLGKMEFLPGEDCEGGHIEFKTVVVGISQNSAKLLKENDVKREELSKSYKAFWACGSEVGNDVSAGVDKVIGCVSHKGQGKNIKAVAGIDFNSFRLQLQNFKKKFRVLFYEVDGGLSFLVLTPLYTHSKFILVDGYCDSGVKSNIIKLIDSKKFSADRVVLIKRYDDKGNVVDEEGTKALESKLQKSGCGGNVVDGHDYKTLAEKGKEMYTKLLSEHVSKDITMTKNKKKVLSDVEGPEYKKHKKHKNGFSKLLDTVKENKGKTLAGFLGLLGLEELWRNGFFSGDKTNEKEKAKNLKKLVEQKDADKYPNRNSAAT